MRTLTQYVVKAVCWNKKAAMRLAKYYCKKVKCKMVEVTKENMRYGI